MNRKMILPLAFAAAVALPYSGGKVLIIETGDMIEMRPSMWLDPRSLDLTIQFERYRQISEMAVDVLESGSPEEETPFDWNQPISQPIFNRDAFAHDAYFAPVTYLNLQQGFNAHM